MWVPLPFLVISLHFFCAATSHLTVCQKMICWTPKLTIPDEFVIKLKCSFWTLSRGTSRPDMITHGFTNLAMTKPSPSLSCHQIALLTTGTTFTSLGASSSTRGEVRASQHPPDHTRSPGQWIVPKIANTSLWAGFWRISITAGLEFPGNWCPESSWELLENLILQPGHSWAAHPGAAPKKALHETTPANTPCSFLTHTG